jgi:hypothetical protein
MPAICWTRYFLQAQGHAVNENIVYQDNKSAILLEMNGKASCSKRTKHINVRYFFVTDRIAKQELNVEWCPTVGHDRGLHDQTTARCFVQETQRLDHGRQRARFRFNEKVSMSTNEY